MIVSLSVSIIYVTFSKSVFVLFDVDEKVGIIQFFACAYLIVNGLFDSESKC
ncbi:putative membrane protein [Ehrlichia chaffeensis str. Heartland]|nr:putative membrane protein [Ehrlichia chaffeensis str. Heartland]AHX09292.1 putative membrane protein [Ehrlichia chaffeensis str. Wakulla]